EVHLSLEGRVEPVLPSLEGAQHGHVLRGEGVGAGRVDVGDAPLVDEHRELALADDELGSHLDLVVVAGEAPGDRVAAVVEPFDDVDELAADHVEQTHTVSFLEQGCRCGRAGRRTSWQTSPVGRLACKNGSGAVGGRGLARGVRVVGGRRGGLPGREGSGRGPPRAPPGGGGEHTERETTTVVRRKTIVTVLKRILFGVLAAQLAVAAALVAVDTWRKRVRPYRAVFPRTAPVTTLVDGTEVTVYTYGEDLFRDMLAAIRSARHRVLFESYILKGDRLGAEFKQALIEAAERGVEVFVVYDGFANLVVPRRFFDFPPTVNVIRYPAFRPGVLL